MRGTPAQAGAMADTVLLVTPDLKAVRKSARRRFADKFKARRARRRLNAHDAKAESLPLRPTGRRRKRTAVAIGISALGISSVSHLAVHADPIAAAQRMGLSNAPQIGSFALEERRHASDLSVSNMLIDAMIEEEGVRYSVYRDVAGYPTVGVGHLVAPSDNLSLGDTISHERAVALLEQDLKTAEEGVRDLVGNLPISQHEFDALVDLVFNVGEAGVSEPKSPRLNAAIGAANYNAIADELTYTAAKNTVAKGLIHRSERRAQIFTAGDYSNPRAA